jgi:hypothetical protein
MKIDDSAIQLYSQHASLEKNERNESLTVWRTGVDRRSASNDGKEKQGLESLSKRISEQSVKVTLSDEAKKAQPSKNETEKVSGQSDMMSDLNLRILQAMIERLTGRKIQTADLMKILSNADAQTQSPPANDTGNAAAQQSGNQTPEPGFGLVYQYHQSQLESESTTFAAQGKIVTQDGKEIDFSTQLSMNREFYSEENQTVKMGEALKDPLVINFNGTAAQLTQTKFSFDLNADGTPEQMAFVSPGSGFLALDKNGDNKINDGSELFGPGTGNGFNELAAYDSDGNNWIDENDPVFNQLRIWTKDTSGQDKLVSLQQSGVGALYLGNVATPYSVKNGENDLLGQVQTTGIFVQENGGVGTLQQVDLVA